MIPFIASEVAAMTRRPGVHLPLYHGRVYPPLPLGNKTVRSVKEVPACTSMPADRYHTDWCHCLIDPMSVLGKKAVASPRPGCHGDVPSAP